MRYSYTAKDSNGKTITGFDEALDVENVVIRLQKQGLFIINVQPFSPNISQSTSVRANTKNKFSHNTVKLDDLLILCRQLATMIESGVTLLRALEVISLQVDSKQLSHALLDIRKNIEHGISLNASLAKYPKIFNQLWVSLIEVGEASGSMPLILQKLAYYMEQRAAFQTAIVSAVIYPIILFVIANIAILIFALMIGPKFKAVFESFHVELPILTKVLLLTFDVIREKFFVVIGIIGVILIIIRSYIRTSLGRIQYEKLLFALPKFGYVYRTIIVERFTSQMSILVESGVPILYSLEITQRMIGNKICEAIIGNIKNSVREGKLIADPMSQSGFFPHMAVQMILIGEETGELGKMLKRVSEYYQDYVQTFVKRFGIMFEPVMLVFMGMIIGVMVIAMFLPIFSLTQVGGSH